jgi:hypothetical protein
MAYAPQIVSSIGTLSLQDAYFSLIDDIDEDDDSRISWEQVAQRHGGVLSEEIVRQVKTVKVYGRVKGSTTAELRTKRGLLQQHLNAGELKLSFNGGTRWLYCYKSRLTFGHKKGSALTIQVFRLEFLALDPFWYEAQVTQDQPVVSSGLTWTVSNAGDETVFPIVTLIANAGTISSGARVLNLTSGDDWTFNASVASGTNLVVDGGEFTVQNNGVNAMSSWTGVMLPLLSGSNTFEFLGSNCTVRVQYYPRYNDPSYT